MDFRALPGETGPQFQARRDFISMGPNRTLTGLCEMYSHRTAAVPTKSLRTIKSWSSKNQWWKLSREHDESIAVQIIENQISEREKQYKAELQEFANFHRGLGRTNINTVAALSRAIASWASKQQDLEITSAQEALEYAKVMSLLEKYSTLWSTALQVDRLIARINDDTIF